MPPKTSPWLEGYVFALSEEGYASGMIEKRCKKLGFAVMASGIRKVLLRARANVGSDMREAGGTRKPHHRPKRNTAVVKKVKALVNKENPATQRIIGQRAGVSQSTVHRIITAELQLVKRRKSSVHALLPRHISERKTNCRKLYERYLAGDKWKFVVTLDEAWIYLSDTNKIRTICYRPKDGKDHCEWVRQCKENFSRGFMIVSGYCHKVKLEIRRVEKNAKINSLYYQTNVLDPLYRSEVPALYGTQATSVWIHQDKASSHTSKSTRAYLTRMEEETGIRAIPFEDIPVKSPDASPMDFCGFGLLKSGLSSRRPITIDGLWKATKEVWSKIDLAVLQSSLLQWKLR